MSRTPLKRQGSGLYLVDTQPPTWDGFESKTADPKEANLRSRVSTLYDYRKYNETLKSYFEDPELFNPQLPTIVTFGKTKAGKSTFIARLVNQSMSPEEFKECMAAKPQMGQPNRIGDWEVGSSQGRLSHTIVPRPVIIGKDGPPELMYNLLDMPGFADSRNENMAHIIEVLRCSALLHVDKPILVIVIRVGVICEHSYDQILGCYDEPISTLCQDGYDDLMKSAIFAFTGLDKKYDELSEFARPDLGVEGGDERRIHDIRDLKHIIAEHRDAVGVENVKLMTFMARFTTRPFLVDYRKSCQDLTADLLSKVERPDSEVAHHPFAAGVDEYKASGPNGSGHESELVDQCKCDLKFVVQAIDICEGRKADLLSAMGTIERSIRHLDGHVASEESARDFISVTEGILQETRTSLTSLQSSQKAKVGEIAAEHKNMDQITGQERHFIAKNKASMVRTFQTFIPIQDAPKFGKKTNKVRAAVHLPHKDSMHRVLVTDDPDTKSLALHLGDKENRDLPEAVDFRLIFDSLQFNEQILPRFASEGLSRDFSVNISFDPSQPVSRDGSTNGSTIIRMGVPEGFYVHLSCMTTMDKADMFSQVIGLFTTLKTNCEVKISALRTELVAIEDSIATTELRIPKQEAELRAAVQSHTESIEISARSRSTLRVNTSRLPVSMMEYEHLVNTQRDNKLLAGICYLLASVDSYKHGELAHQCSDYYSQFSGPDGIVAKLNATISRLIEDAGVAMDKIPVSDRDERKSD